MFCRLNEYWCKQAVMWWRLGRWKHFLIAQIAFRDFVFFHIRSEVKMEFTAQNMNFVLSWNTWMNLKDLFSHAQQSQRWSLICKTVTRENASVLAPQGMSLPSLRLCLTAFKLFFREDIPALSGPFKKIFCCSLEIRMHFLWQTDLISQHMPDGERNLNSSSFWPNKEVTVWLPCQRKQKREEWGRTDW